MMLRFATELYKQKAAVAYHGHLRRDPMSRLHLAEGRRDPYAIYDELRAAGPLVGTRLGNYVTTSHEICGAVLRDRRFGVRPPGVTGQSGMMSFLEMDPPEHGRLRRLAQPAFSPRYLADWRPKIEARVSLLLDDAGRAGRFDLVDAFAAPLPIAVITDLLGVPDADAETFAVYGAAIGGALDGIKSLGHAMRLQRAQAELQALFDRLFALRRRDPADDLVSRLVAAEGDRIRPAEMVPMTTLLLVAGFETTVNLIGNAVHALLEHPDQWADLCADPAGLAAKAVEETLRWNPPVQRTGRTAHEQVTLAGRTVRRGQVVVTLLGAANRDPAVYPDPDRFDIHREPAAEHLAFSGGIHYCVGAPLARLEAAIALQRLAERMPGLTRAGLMRRRNSTLIRGPLHLPVRAGTGRTGRTRKLVGPPA